MKAHITLRSTLSNTSSLQRGGAALALMALISALLIYVARPSAQSIPRAQVGIPVQRTSPNVPISGTGSAYDGGHYTGALPVTRVSPNVPISGTGSAYDGGHYTGALPVTRV